MNIRELYNKMRRAGETLGLLYKAINEAEDELARLVARDVADFLEIKVDDVDVHYAVCSPGHSELVITVGIMDESLAPDVSDQIRGRIRELTGCEPPLLNVEVVGPFPREYYDVKNQDAQLAEAVSEIGGGA